MTAHFLFVCTTPGSEKALKEEMKLRYSSFHPSYGRPGFLTFKETSSRSALTPSTPFQLLSAQSYGVCLFRSSGADLPEKLSRALQESPFKKIYFHLWKREYFFAPLPPLPPFPSVSSQAEAEGVICLLQVEEDEWWVGLHAATWDHALFPSALPFLPLPDEAPSRSYLKMKEALFWIRPPLRPGDWALELGASPGGMSYALLQEGVNVLGVDPGQFHPSCLSFQKIPRFIPFHQPVQKIALEGFPPSVLDDILPPRWLVVDLNLHPRESLEWTGKLVKKCAFPLEGIFFTFKVKNFSFIREFPQYKKDIENLGFSRVVGGKLPSNRQEIFVYAGK